MSEVMIPDGWSLRKVKDFTKSKSISNVQGDKPPVLSVTKYAGFVIQDQYFNKNVHSKDISRYKLVEKGDFAYATIHLDEGSIALLTDFESGLISPMYTVFQIDGSVDPYYLLTKLKTPKMIRTYQTIGQGTVDRRKSVPYKALSSLELPLPPLPEQKKIAAILSSVDDAIAKTKAVIEQTKTLKKGMMQKLLTRGIGHTKFKKTEIGEIPEGWEVKLLDEISKRGSGHTPNKKKAEYWNGGIKWISLTDSRKLDVLFISNTDKEISQLGIENSSAVLHPEGTVVLSRDAGIGKSSIMSEPMAVSQHFIVWTCTKVLNKFFLFYWLQYKKTEFERVAIGSTIKTIGLPYFKKLQMPLPNIVEQKKIVDLLLSMDAKLDVHEREVATLINIKQALMQQLLTGKVRVSI